MDKEYDAMNTKSETEIHRNPSIALYREADLADIMKASGNALADDFGDMRSEEAKRALYLKNLAGSFIGPERDLVGGDPDMIERLCDLAEASPNLRPLIDLFVREARSSSLSGAAMAMPPIIMLGPPGVGKTHVVRRLADALGTAFVPVEMAMIDDIGELCGHSLSWKAARPGVVARALLDGTCASPVVLIDEIEKTPKFSHSDNFLDLFHTLFEPENAARFKDQYLGLELRADRIFWIATANSIDLIPATVIDRCLIIRIGRPSLEEGRAIARQVFKEFACDRRSFQIRLSTLCIDPLAEHPPRAIRKALHLAAGFAAERGSSAIGSEDIEAAIKLICPKIENDRRCGFL